ncbi:MAG TPA: response regulator [Anaeromyxobacteraceae bacterium]|nr:response regulator [Anaeromyxobacteraceae bacterium]
MRKPRVLLVDDKKPMLELLATILASYDVTTARDAPRAALALLAPQPFELAFIDVRLPGADGHELLKVVKTASPSTEVVMITAFATVADAVAGMKEGAFDYLTKPFDPDDVSLAAARALEHRRQKVREAAGRLEEGGAGGCREGDLCLSMSYREAAEAGRDRASRVYLIALMREFNGKVVPAAERAGMERESLHRLLRRYRIRSLDFKDDQPGAPAAGARDWDSRDG